MSIDFNVSASGAPPLNYQWYFNGNPISAATSTNLMPTNVQPPNTGSYYVLVSNGGGSVQSSNTTLTVNLIWPWLTNITCTSNTIALELHCSPGRTNVLEVTSDLAKSSGDAPVWTPLVTFLPPSLPKNFTNPPATNCFFYRLRTP